MSDPSAQETPASVISDEMRGIVGKELRRHKSYPVDASDIRKWAIAAYFPEPPPAEFMEPGPDGRLIAPQEFNPFAWALAEGTKKKDIGAGSLEREAGITPPDLKFIVNGGVVNKYHGRIYEGDVIVSSYSVARYEEKHGRRGVLLFTDTQEKWTNQRGELVCTKTLTLVRY